MESTHTIEIESFVAREDVDELYLDEPYYLVPDGKVAYEAFAVIREAMRQEDLVGIARLVLYRRERLLMLEPRDEGIVGTTLRYANEVRNAADYFEDIPDAKIARDTLDLAKHILQTKKGRFDPSKFKDRYETALKELIAAKQAGRAPRAPPPQPGNVVNLMDALRRSVQAERRGAGGRRASHGARTAQRRRSVGRKKLRRAS